MKFVEFYHYKKNNDPTEPEQRDIQPVKEFDSAKQPVRKDVYGFSYIEAENLEAAQGIERKSRVSCYVGNKDDVIATEQLLLDDIFYTQMVETFKANGFNRILRQNGYLLQGLQDQDIVLNRKDRTTAVAPLKNGLDL